jgi:hypothetical protein
MTPKEFLQKFLPNYEEKIKELDNEENLVTRGLRYRHFQDKYFPEALKNYTRLLCDMQKETCVRAWRKCDKFNDYIPTVLFNAEQPKIESL